MAPSLPAIHRLHVDAQLPFQGPGGGEGLVPGVIERAQVMPFAELERAGGRRGLFLAGDVAIKPQAVIGVGQQQIGFAVAVVIDPGRGGQIVEGFLGQHVRVVAELVAQVGEQPGAGGRGQEQIGLAVAVVVGPDGGAGAADAGERHFIHGFAAVLQQQHLAAADQAEVGLAVAVEIDDGHGLGLIDARQRRIMGEAGHAGDAFEVFAAPADEIAFGL